MKIDYNKAGDEGLLINPITDEQVACRIRARLLMPGRPTVYRNLHRLPLDCFIGKSFSADNQPKHVYLTPNQIQYRPSNYRVREMIPEMKMFPMLLKNVTTGIIQPVFFTSCWFRGNKFLHIRVRESRDPLTFVEQVEKRRIEYGTART